MRYRSDPEEGWEPRVGVPGAPGLTCQHWTTVFKSSNPETGTPLSVQECVPLLKYKGQRQHWR